LFKEVKHHYLLEVVGGLVLSLWGSILAGIEQIGDIFRLDHLP